MSEFTETVAELFSLSAFLATVGLWALILGGVL